ncbi:MAG TPA: lysophospholipid acyltransferase family protein [Pseudomonadales bacterium]|nr:lysophospholipid acyltransferase family protein [Pseudomonadales bacterium]
MSRFFLKFGCLPDRVLYALSAVLYLFIFYIFRYRRQTVHDNLLRAFPEKTSSERSVLAREFYRHLADVVVEVLILARLSEKELLQRVEVVGREHLVALTGRSQSFIMMAAHQANWEWMVAAMSVVCPCPMDALYRPLHDDFMEMFFHDVRKRFGASLIPADGAAKAILKLRKELRAFGMIADQNPRRQDDKLWISFLGVETPVFPGPERIATLMNYPVLFVGMEKLARGRYRCSISPLAEPPYAEHAGICARYMQAVEAQIMRQPALWMWSHQRWRYTRAQCPDVHASPVAG